MKKRTKNYDTVHAWIKKNFGKADHCDLCGSGRNYQWSNMDHKYTRSLMKWWQLCAKCHDGYDRAILGKKTPGGKKGQKAWNKGKKFPLFKPPNYVGLKTNCAFCRKSFSIEPARFAQNVKCFCSRVCRYKWMAGKPARNKGKRTFHDMTCRGCGRNYKTQRKKSKFCNLKCFRSALKPE